VSEWAEPESTSLNAAPVGNDRAANNSADPVRSSTHHTTQGTGAQGKTCGHRARTTAERGSLQTQEKGRNSSRFGKRNAARFSSQNFADISADSESVDDQTSTAISTQNLASASTGASSFQTLCASTAISSAS